MSFTTMSLVVFCITGTRQTFFFWKEVSDKVALCWVYSLLLELSFSPMQYKKIQPSEAKFWRKGVKPRTDFTQLQKKKPHFHWQDKHRQNTRSSETYIQHFAFDNLKAALGQHQQSYIFSFIWEDWFRNHEARFENSMDQTDYRRWWRFVENHPELGNQAV